MGLENTIIGDKTDHNLQTCTEQVVFFFHTAGVESTKLSCNCRMSDRKQKQVKNCSHFKNEVLLGK